MRKPVLYVLIAVIVVLVGVAVAFFVKYQKTSAQFANMKTAEETSRAGYAEAFNAITEIQDSLNAIAVGDSALRAMTAGGPAELKVTEAMRRQALERVASLNASLKRNRERIRQLEVSLKKSGLHVASLEQMIAGLKQQVTERQTFVEQLSVRVDSLQTTVTGLQTEVVKGQEAIAAQDQVIEQKRSELATVFYVVGSRKELLNLGVVTAKGGILGLGKTLVGSGHYNESFFTALDTDRETVVPTAAARVQVLTSQPASSYELKQVGGHTDLHILDPREFRKVRHLIIMTK